MLSETPEYMAWKAMIARCTKPHHPRFPRYGGRGIVVCEAWRSSFQTFLADVGHRPFPDASIGRIDNDGHYEPNNVRWETPTEQQRNTCRNHQLTINGETKTLAAWASENGLKWKTLWNRVEEGWPTERLLLPSGQYGKKLTADSAEQIRLLRKSNVSIDAIAETYGVSVSMVEKIVYGECWNRVPE